MIKKSKSDTAEGTCSVDYAFQRIGGKYKGRIIWALKDKVMRYGELRRYVQGITPKMLTQALRELEEDGLVQRTVYPEVLPRVEYFLTGEAKELLPFIELLACWAEKQMQKRGIPSMLQHAAPMKKAM